MIRTGYSFHHAVGHLEDVISRIKEIGWTHAPICDLNSTFGFVKWTKLCEQNGLKPIYGVELNVTPSLGEKKPIFDRWKFLAIDSLKPLHDLIALATSNPGREPSLTYKQALSAEGLVKITGERLLCDEFNNEIARIFSSDHIFIGLSPSVPKSIITYFFNTKITWKIRNRFIPISDNFYPRITDREFYRVSLGKRSNSQSYPQHILDDEEWRDAVWWMMPRDEVSDYGLDVIAIRNRDAIFKLCNAKLEKATLLVPKKPKSLRELCIEGSERVGVDLANLIYSERLDRELTLIAEKNFEDYFFIIADMVNWAKERMIVGPARGSSCGSLVCYLLNITSIDPVAYNLVFERFIDTSRSDLPDIDLDFDDGRRSLVFDYMEQKYGQERVARLGTVGMFQEKSAIKVVSDNLKIPKWEVDKDPVASAFKERLLEHPSNASQHAAGIVLTQKQISNYVAVDMRTNSVMCDKIDAESLNLLKIDALGLTQLSIFQRTFDLFKDKVVISPLVNFNNFLSSIPLDDSKAFDVLNKGHFCGIFQFAGQALQALTRQMKIESLEDMVAITSLARPGPMDTGASQKWINRRTGREAIHFDHYLFEPILKDTYGIPIYQEQIMRIAREIGDLSWADVNALRRVMGKSQGAEAFNVFGEKWKEGALSKGIEADTVNRAWNSLCTFGRYGFNRSHAVAYAIISYWCCWLKAYHPLEFAAATLDSENDPQKQIALLRELSLEGVNYIPVDIELSTDKWMPSYKDGQPILVGPLTQIKGFGDAIVREIIDAKQNDLPLKSTIVKRMENAKTEIDSLYPVKDAISQVAPDLPAIGIVSEPVNIKNVQCGINGDIVVLGVINKIKEKDENEPDKVSKRGYAFKGPHTSLNMFFRDDTDEIFAKINRYDFERLAKPIIERGKVGKALYAVKGKCPENFRMISVSQIKFLGFME